MKNCLSKIEIFALCSVSESNFCFFFQQSLLFFAEIKQIDLARTMKIWQFHFKPQMHDESDAERKQFDMNFQSKFSKA